jgi:hypothetical protein
MVKRKGKRGSSWGETEKGRTAKRDWLTDRPFGNVERPLEITCFPLRGALEKIVCFFSLPPPFPLLSLSSLPRLNGYSLAALTEWSRKTLVTTAILERGTSNQDQ